MKNFADHILDIAENSIRANASKVEILFSVNSALNFIKLSFIDDGEGMSDDLIERIKDPFFSTRKERRIGMGIPLLIQNCEMSGGEVTIQSGIGEGTIVVALFEKNNLDRPPIGDVADAIYSLVSSHINVHFIFTFTMDGKSFLWDTDDAQEAFGGVVLSEPKLRAPIMEMLNSNISDDF